MVRLEFHCERSIIILFGDENCYQASTKNKTTTIFVTGVSTFPETSSAVFFRLKLNHFPCRKCLKEHKRSCFVTFLELLALFSSLCPKNHPTFFLVFSMFQI